MRSQMVTRIYICSGLLIISIQTLLSAGVVSRQRFLASPNLYVRVRPAECSRTKLVIKLEGVDRRPDHLTISIVNKDDGLTELKPTVIALAGDEYIWSGLLSLGDFTLTVVNDKDTLIQRFTNLKLVEQFQDQESRLIQVRGGKDSLGVRQASKVSEDIAIPALNNDEVMIHLMLIGSDNKLVAQYIGRPISSWRVTVAEGSYKLVLVAYSGDSRPCHVYSKRS